VYSDATPATDPQNDELDAICEKDSYGIKVLYNPPSAGLDIVFVHGLTGSAYSTWYHEEGSKHWPRDLLKSDISDARVMTFGYDADITHFWKEAVQDGISGYADDLLGKLSRKRRHVVSVWFSILLFASFYQLCDYSDSEMYQGNRKIVFVAHSLGGLLTQRALTFSRNSRFKHLQRIEAWTVGICFLGTPHHGADLAKWGRILTDIVSIAKPANSALVRLLERGSEVLRDVQGGFHNLLETRKDEGSKIGITCFYETLPTSPFTGALVVPTESAIISGELNYPIRANHVVGKMEWTFMYYAKKFQNMTKFSNRKALGYEDVIEEIRRLANHDPHPRPSTQCTRPNTG